jgi:hypothetical protein
MSSRVITVVVDNGTSHSLPVDDIQTALNAAHEAIVTGRPFWVGTYPTRAVFDSSKIVMVTGGRPS